jgi:non-heme chloroperoxidase
VDGAAQVLFQIIGVCHDRLVKLGLLVVVAAIKLRRHRLFQNVGRAVINFYSADGPDGIFVSDRVIQSNWTAAIGASPVGTLACVDAWLEDFRDDLLRNDVPTMIIHGDDDRILPADACSRRQAKMIKNVEYLEIKGGSHGITWTRAEQINNALVKFLA